MGCYDTQYLTRVTAIGLDECGRIPLPETNPTPAIKGLADGLQSVAWAENLEQPAEQTQRTVKGGTCQKPRGTPSDNGSTFTLTFCGLNPYFEALIGFKRVYLDGEGAVAGFDRIQINQQTNVALEIIFAPLADACEGGEEALCTAMLVPLLEGWTLTGDRTQDGQNVPDLVAAGSTRLNPRLFQNYETAGELPEFLAHWAPRFDDIADGDAFYYGLDVTCPTDEGISMCQFVAIDATS